MAGFYLVSMMLVIIMIVVIIWIAFEIMSVLSIVFSAISLSKSKRYVSTGGRYDYRSVKRFHTVSVVFFVLGCIGLFSAGIGIITMLFALFDNSYDYSHGSAADLLESLPFLILTVGQYAAMLILGVKSFGKFSEAKGLQNVLCRNASVMRQTQYVGARNGFGQGYADNFSPRYGQPQTNAPPPVYVQFSPCADQPSFNFTTQNKNGTAAEDTSSLGNDAPKKICPKCGKENNGIYKFCTLCGERLE
ncbi:MAG: hypothetical protein NC394_07645 [Bacteroides sp.]|nr:hypothetical protein [Bacteroides sp.]